VLVLSASAEQADVLAAVKNGASGYMVKSASLSEFDEAVRRTAEGDAVFSAGLAGLLLGEYRRLGAGPEVPQLTDRETEVLRLVARGLTARQIATRLVLSHRTVENHVQNTLRKLQLQTAPSWSATRSSTASTRPTTPSPAETLAGPDHSCR
jgi:DNA-binding NarL/FixJ family response regulator